jgi:hypothetical protein
MLRASLLFAVLTACGSDVNHLPDAAEHDAAVAHDAAVMHDAAGSGSNAFAAIDAHPRDRKLELLVAGLAAIVVVVPVRRSRRGT